MIIWPCNRKNKNKTKFMVSCKFNTSRHFNKWPCTSKLSAILLQTKHLPLPHLRHAAFLLRKPRLLVLEWLFQHHQKFSSMKLAFHCVDTKKKLYIYIYNMGSSSVPVLIGSHSLCNSFVVNQFLFFTPNGENSLCYTPKKQREQYGGKKCFIFY